MIYRLVLETSKLIIKPLNIKIKLSLLLMKTERKYKQTNFMSLAIANDFFITKAFIKKKQ